MKFCPLDTSCEHAKVPIFFVNFGNYISAIYLSELQLTATSTSSTEVCYLDTDIKTGSTNTPFSISIYDKGDDFTFRTATFPPIQLTVFIYLN